MKNMMLYSYFSFSVLGLRKKGNVNYNDGNMFSVCYKYIGDNLLLEIEKSCNASE